MKHKLAIFASGSGTNAENMMTLFHDHPEIDVSLVLSNKQDAFVLERAKRHLVPVFTFTYKELHETTRVLEELKKHQITFIVLAGFMIRIPASLIQAYPDKIVNIHPALLPKFGGKGMYGMHVHEAVVKAGETETGISIHYVNEIYDDGRIIAQATCPVLPVDSPEAVARKVHALEYVHYPKVIEKLLCG